MVVGVKVLEIFVFTLRKHIICMLDILSNSSIFFPKKNDPNDNTKTTFFKKQERNLRKVEISFIFKEIWQLSRSIDIT